MKVGGHPLSKLLQLRCPEHVLELRLADQNDLEELMLVDVDVRQHPEFLERLQAEVLRLVDNQDDVATLVMLGIQKLLKLLEQDRVRSLERLVERHHHPDQKAVTWRGVGDKADGDFRIERFQQMPYQRRLTGADLARDNGEAGLVHHPKFQHGISQAMVLAPIDEVWIGQDGKRLFSEPIK